MKQRFEQAKVIRQLVEEAKSLLAGDKDMAAKLMDAKLPGWTIIAVADPDAEIVDPEVLEASDDDAEPNQDMFRYVASQSGIAPERTDADPEDKAARIKRCLCALKRALEESE